jgi:heat shock protein HslJ
MNPVRLLAAAVPTLAIALLPVAGCSATPRQPQAAAEPAVKLPLEATVWECASVNDLAVTEGAAPTLEIAEDGKASGNSGVNRFGARADADGAAIRFTMVVSTRMAGPEDRMRLEASFLAALERARGFRIDGTLLTLMDEKGSVVATFLGHRPEPQPAAQ